jgi:hypothetical protein
MGRLPSRQLSGYLENPIKVSWAERIKTLDLATEVIED